MYTHCTQGYFSSKAKARYILLETEIRHLDKETNFIAPKFLWVRFS